MIDNQLVGRSHGRLNGTNLLPSWKETQIWQASITRMHRWKFGLKPRPEAHLRSSIRIPCACIREISDPRRKRATCRLPKVCGEVCLSIYFHEPNTGFYTIQPKDFNPFSKWVVHFFEFASENLFAATDWGSICFCFFFVCFVLILWWSVDVGYPNAYDKKLGYTGGLVRRKRKESFWKLMLLLSTGQDSRVWLFFFLLRVVLFLKLELQKLCVYWLLGHDRVHWSNLHNHVDYCSARAESDSHAHVSFSHAWSDCWKSASGLSSTCKHFSLWIFFFENNVVC